MQARTIALAVAVGMLGTLPARAQSGFARIVGGPSYDPVTGNGLQGGGMHHYPCSSLNDAGMAVGFADKYVSGTPMGERAVRWDAGGTAATELGNLGTAASGYTASWAYSINAAGTAVGHAYSYSFVSGIATQLRAVRWDAGGTAATELGGLGTPVGFCAYAYALAVNDAGTAVGQADKYVNGSWGRPAVRWDAGGTAATELGNLGTAASGITNGCAYSINGDGTAVGHAEKYVDGVCDGYRAVRWDAGGTAATELGGLGPAMGTHGEAISINAAGTAVGHAEKYVDAVNVGYRAVRWDAGGTAATELGNLGTRGDGRTWAFVYAMNDAGTAVGFADKYVSGNCIGERAVRWDAGGTAATELGNLGTDSSELTDSRAYSVSDAGTAVGYARNYVSGIDMGDRAVVWGLDGAAIDLNTLIDPGSGWCLTNAYAISSNGRYIAGAGYYDPDGTGAQTSYQRLYTMDLSTIPEPASLSLLGLGGLVLLRRRGLLSLEPRGIEPLTC